MDSKKGFVRKHFFINRRLQGSYMLTFLVPMIIMLLFMIFTLYFTSQTIVNATTTTIKKDIQRIENSSLQDTDQPTVQMYKKLNRDISDYLRNFSSNEQFRKSVLSTLVWVFGIGLLIVIIQIVLLTIFFSHKLAGPIYRLERVCHGLINGNYSQRVILRKGDEMQNLATLLDEAISNSRKLLLEIGNEPDEEKRKKLLKSLNLNGDESN